MDDHGTEIALIKEQSKHITEELVELKAGQRAIMNKLNNGLSSDVRSLKEFRSVVIGFFKWAGGGVLTLITGVALWFITRGG